MKNLLVAIDYFVHPKEEINQLFKSKGIIVTYNDLGRELDFIKDFKYYENIDYVIAGTENYNKKFFEKFKKIILISRVGVGTDNIDKQAAKKNNVKIFITSDSPSVAVAELCIGNIINLNRQIINFNKQIKSKKILKPMGTDLRGATVGIVGFGSIGKELAKRLIPMEVKLLGYGRNWEDDFYYKYKIKRVDLNYLFKNSDIVSIHLPLAKETYKLIDKKLINKMKKNSILINTSRSGVIDNKYLFLKLKDKSIKGAAIDVFEEENLINDFSNFSNVILTPHIGSHTAETRNIMEKHAIRNLIKFHNLKNKLEDNGSIDKDLEYLKKFQV